MKTAVQIAQEIKKHKPIDKMGMYDETWEDYMRGREMTNGEKLKATFPNLKIMLLESYVQVMGKNYEFSNVYPLKWWNAEYKEPSSSENPISSTTKNGISIPDIKYHSHHCVDRRLVEALVYRYLKEDTDDHVAFYEELLDLPLVTPVSPKGHWIMTNDYFTGAYESIDYVECSCCHADSLEEGNYCPNCGAEMSEVEK